MIGIFVWLATLIFGFIGFIWSKNDWLNLIIKFALYACGVLGLVILVQQNGFTGIPLK